MSSATSDNTESINLLGENFSILPIVNPSLVEETANIVGTAYK